MALLIFVLYFVASKWLAVILLSFGSVVDCRDRIVLVF